MRLSDYVAAPRDEAAVGPRVLAVVTPALAALGAGEDPEGWLAWGDDPGIRWQFLAPTAAGLVTCSVRVNVAGEGPRAGAKVTRWPRVQVGELAIESAAGGCRSRRSRSRASCCGAAARRRRRSPRSRSRCSGRSTGPARPGDRAAPALRRRPVRPGRRARGQRAVVERRPDRVRDDAWPGLDPRRPHAVMGANSRGWALIMRTGSGSTTWTPRRSRTRSSRAWSRATGPSHRR